MIKINLLPIKAARKREYVKQQLILFAVLLVGTGVGLYLWYSSMAGSIANEKKEIAHIRQQIEQYRTAIGKVEEYKGLEAKLKRKLEIIENLIKGKTGPVRVLDKLSQVIPKQVWLTEWDENNGNVKIKGEALTNKHVAEFMSALKLAIEPTGTGGTGGLPAAEKKQGKHYFTNVQLLETKMDKTSQYGRRFVKFEISMKITYAI